MITCISHNLALTSMSLKDVPLLLAVIGGFLKMVLSKGRFCIKSQLSIRNFFRCRTDGWYVTKCKTRLRVLFFCKRADCLVAKSSSDSVLRISFLGCKRRNLNLKGCLRTLFEESLF